MSEFDDLCAAGLTEAVALTGEEVTIGTWTGLAIVDGGPRFLQDVPGGVYPKLLFTILVSKADLDDVIPEAQMDVTARGKTLRIADDGIMEDQDSYTITSVGRTVPR